MAQIFGRLAGRFAKYKQPFLRLVIVRIVLVLLLYKNDALYSWVQRIAVAAAFSDDGDKTHDLTCSNNNREKIYYETASDVKTAGIRSRIDNDPISVNNHALLQVKVSLIVVTSVSSSLPPPLKPKQKQETVYPSSFKEMIDNRNLTWFATVDELAVVQYDQQSRQQQQHWAKTASENNEGSIHFEHMLNFNWSLKNGSKERKGDNESYENASEGGGNITWLGEATMSWLIPNFDPPVSGNTPLSSRNPAGPNLLVLGLWEGIDIEPTKRLLTRRLARMPGELSPVVTQQQMFPNKPPAEQSDCVGDNGDKNRNFPPNAMHSIRTDNPLLFVELQATTSLSVPVLIIPVDEEEQYKQQGGEGTNYKWGQTWALLYTNKLFNPMSFSKAAALIHATSFIFASDYDLKKDYIWTLFLWMITSRAIIRLINVFSMRSLVRDRTIFPPNSCTTRTAADILKNTRPLASTSFQTESEANNALLLSSEEPKHNEQENSHKKQHFVSYVTEPASSESTSIPADRSERPKTKPTCSSASSSYMSSLSSSTESSSSSASSIYSVGDNDKDIPVELSFDLAVCSPSIRLPTNFDSDTNKVSVFNKKNWALDISTLRSLEVSEPVQKYDLSKKPNTNSFPCQVQIPPIGPMRSSSTEITSNRYRCIEAVPKVTVTRDYKVFLRKNTGHCVVHDNDSNQNLTTKQKQNSASANFNVKKSPPFQQDLEQHNRIIPNGSSCRLFEKIMTQTKNNCKLNNTGMDWNRTEEEGLDDIADSDKETTPAKMKVRKEAASVNTTSHKNVQDAGQDGDCSLIKDKCTGETNSANYVARGPLPSVPCDSLEDSKCSIAGIHSSCGSKVQMSQQGRNNDADDPDSPNGHNQCIYDIQRFTDQTRGLPNFEKEEKSENQFSDVTRDAAVDEEHAISDARTTTSIILSFGQWKKHFRNQERKELLPKASKAPQTTVTFLDGDKTNESSKTLLEVDDASGCPPSKASGINKHNNSMNDEGEPPNDVTCSFARGFKKNDPRLLNYQDILTLRYQDIPACDETYFRVDEKAAGIASNGRSLLSTTDNEVFDPVRLKHECERAFRSAAPGYQERGRLDAASLIHVAPTSHIADKERVSSAYSTMGDGKKTNLKYHSVPDVKCNKNDRDTWASATFSFRHCKGSNEIILGNSTQTIVEKLSAITNNGFLDKDKDSGSTSSTKNCFGSSSPLPVMITQKTTLERIENGTRREASCLLEASMDLGNRDSQVHDCSHNTDSHHDDEIATAPIGKAWSLQSVTTSSAKAKKSQILGSFPNLRNDNPSNQTEVKKSTSCSTTNEDKAWNQLMINNTNATITAGASLVSGSSVSKQEQDAYEGAPPFSVNTKNVTGANKRSTFGTINDTGSLIESGEAVAKGFENKQSTALPSILDNHANNKIADTMAEKGRTSMESENKQCFDCSENIYIGAHEAQKATEKQVVVCLEEESIHAVDRPCFATRDAQSHHGTTAEEEICPGTTLDSTTSLQFAIPENSTPQKYLNNCEGEEKISNNLKEQQHSEESNIDLGPLPKIGKNTDYFVESKSGHKYQSIQVGDTDLPQRRASCDCSTAAHSIELFAEGGAMSGNKADNDVTRTRGDDHSLIDTKDRILEKEGSCSTMVKTCSSQHSQKLPVNTEDRSDHQLVKRFSLILNRSEVVWDNSKGASLNSIDNSTWNQAQQLSSENNRKGKTIDATNDSRGNSRCSGQIELNINSATGKIVDWSLDRRKCAPQKFQHSARSAPCIIQQPPQATFLGTQNHHPSLSRNIDDSNSPDSRHIAVEERVGPNKVNMGTRNFGSSVCLIGTELSPGVQGRHVIRNEETGEQPSPAAKTDADKKNIQTAEKISLSPRSTIKPLTRAAASTRKGDDCRASVENEKSQLALYRADAVAKIGRKKNETDSPTETSVVKDRATFNTLRENAAPEKVKMGVLDVKNFDFDKTRKRNGSVDEDKQRADGDAKRKCEKEPRFRLQSQISESGIPSSENKALGVIIEQPYEKRRKNNNNFQNDEDNKVTIRSDTGHCLRNVKVSMEKQVSMSIALSASVSYAADDTIDRLLHTTEKTDFHTCGSTPLGKEKSNGDEGDAKEDKSKDEVGGASLVTADRKASRTTCDKSARNQAGENLGSSNERKKNSEMNSSAANPRNKSLPRKNILDNPKHDSKYRAVETSNVEGVSVIEEQAADPARTPLTKTREIWLRKLRKLPNRESKSPTKDIFLHELHDRTSSSNRSLSNRSFIGRQRFWCKPEEECSLHSMTRMIIPNEIECHSKKKEYNDLLSYTSTLPTHSDCSGHKPDLGETKKVEAKIIESYEHTTAESNRGERDEFASGAKEPHSNIGIYTQEVVAKAGNQNKNFEVTNRIFPQKEMKLPPTTPLSAESCPGQLEKKGNGKDIILWTKTDRDENFKGEQNSIRKQPMDKKITSATNAAEEPSCSDKKELKTSYHEEQISKKSSVDFENEEATMTRKLKGKASILDQQTAKNLPYKNKKDSTIPFIEEHASSESPFESRGPLSSSNCGGNPRKRKLDITTSRDMELSPVSAAPDSNNYEVICFDKTISFPTVSVHDRWNVDEMSALSSSVTSSGYQSEKMGRQNNINLSNRTQSNTTSTKSPRSAYTTNTFDNINYNINKNDGIRSLTQNSVRRPSKLKHRKRRKLSSVLGTHQLDRRDRNSSTGVEGGRERRPGAVPGRGSITTASDTFSRSHRSNAKSTNIPEARCHEHKSAHENAPAATAKDKQRQEVGEKKKKIDVVDTPLLTTRISPSSSIIPDILPDVAPSSSLSFATRNVHAPVWEFAATADANATNDKNKKKMNVPSLTPIRPGVHAPVAAYVDTISTPGKTKAIKSVYSSLRSSTRSLRGPVRNFDIATETPDSKRKKIVSPFTTSGTKCINDPTWEIVGNVEKSERKKKKHDI